jgi:hypothetical protein
MAHSPAIVLWLEDAHPILSAACSLEVNAALPTGFAHALESWVRAIFWRLRSGLEVSENTGKQQGRDV